MPTPTPALPTTPHRYLTVQDLAASLQVSERFVRRAIRSGALAATWVGDGYRIETAEAERWIATHPGRPRRPGSPRDGSPRHTQAHPGPRLAE